MPLPLETPRLRIRPFVPRDLTAIHELIGSDPEVQRYRHLPVAATVDESRPFFEILLEHQRTHGFSLWAVEDRATGRLLGQSGFVQLRGPVELAYSFGSKHWGQGYATEAARACLDFGFADLGLTSIVAFVDPDNLGSRRVAEKIGMRSDGQETHDGRVLLRYAAP